ncbi:hypothetical protein [Oceanicola sp. S124]|uniref:hypothetical protein n=1 Tax=Oceanicola sp. S124 TaxID=1042378 RepID=UPI000255A3E1|nr:hypothetical protein [Oceanicola sp. S124]
MARNLRFLLTLWLALMLLWAFSGERIVDWVFELPLPDALMDPLLDAVFWGEDLKAALGLPDLFGALRALLHGLAGL